MRERDNEMTTTLIERQTQVKALADRVKAAKEQIEFKRQDYTVDEIAALMGVTRNLIYEAVKKSEIGFYRVGRKIRITPEHLAAFRAGTLAGE